MFHSKRAFTLVEIMIVVAILGILLVLLAPSFVKSRRQARDRMCQNNLRLIKHALEEYKIDENLMEDTDVTGIYEGVIVNSSFAYIKVEPLCPIENRQYHVTTVDADPTCPNWEADPADIDHVHHVLQQ